MAIPGESIRVFSIGEGREVIRVPYARAFLPLVGSQILLVDRAWLALYRDGKEVFRRSHDLYYPRLILADRENRNALIGCHHEVVLADIQEGRIASRWKTPASFDVISIGGGPGLYFSKGNDGKFVVNAGLSAQYAMTGPLREEFLGHDTELRNSVHFPEFPNFENETSSR